MEDVIYCMSSSDIYLQHLWIWSLLNDFMNCLRRFNETFQCWLWKYISISALGHASKLKFSSYVHPLSVNQIFQYRLGNMLKPRLHGHAIFACVIACDIGFKWSTISNRECLDGLRCVMTCDPLLWCDALRLKMFHSQRIGPENRRLNPKALFTRTCDFCMR